MDEISIWDGRIIASSTGEVTTLYNSGTPLDYAPTVIVEATSSTPFVNRGGSVRINGGSFRNTQK
jgi:uncharacterized protein (UPF0210 family)